jgi:excinuclease ABC subunit C
VDLKDDKSYPYFRITVHEEFPRMEVTRNVKDDGSIYFGPFTDAGSARRTMAWLEKAFPLRRCRGSSPGGRTRPGRPCLDHQMGKCTGPCSDEVSSEEYGRSVEGIVSFLKGDGRKVTAELQAQMDQHAAMMEYEEAAALRDRLAAIRSVLEKQDVVGDPGEDLDILGFAASGSISALTCLFVRSGTIVGRKDLTLSASYGPEEAVDAFVSGHYRRKTTFPAAVICPVDLDFAGIHQDVVSEAAGRKVRVIHPRRGRKVKLLKLAEENARQALRAADSLQKEGRLLSTELKTGLRMAVVPDRVECIDISHTSGKNAYGSLAVWEKGQLKKDEYRLFSIGGQSTAGDDYAALRELVLRRFTGSQADKLKLPDLLLVDGGKGQLSSVVAILEQTGIELPQVAAIAKGREGATDSIFIPGRANPLAMKSYSAGFRLLQRLRDEAHRFAVTTHRKGRNKSDMMSVLESIDGVGPVRRRTLLTNYRSVAEIKAAPEAELAALKGFNSKLARKIKEELQ